MSKPIVVVGSITYAMKGQKVLSNYGIYSSIERNTSNYGGRGCGYCLRVSAPEQRVREILTSEHIKIIDIVYDGGMGYDLF